MILILLIFTMLLPSTNASASSPRAWAALDRKVERACLVKSGLKRPHMAPKTISFSDAIGIEVRVIRGTDRHGRAQKLLCAYDRRTARVEVQEAGD